MAEEMQRSMPLAGLTVVEVGDAYVGRLLARILGEQGARVERCAWPPLSEGADGAVRELIGAADVLVDTTPSGVLDRGSADEHPAVKGGLIVCRVATLPAEAGATADAPCEWIAAAELGFHRPRGEAAPTLEPLALASTYAALHAALLIGAALADGVTGAPRVIEQSLFGAGLLALCGRLQHLDNEQIRSAAKRHGVPIAERYLCADGRYIQSEGTVPDVARSMCAAFGHPEWAEAAVEGLSGVESAEAEQAWRDRFAGCFSERPSWEWEEAIASFGGAASVCRTREEWAAEPHVRETEILLPTPEDGAVLGVGPAVRIYEHRSSGGRPSTRSPLATAKGEGPLAGTRVVDLCVILAGPTCGRLLGELGADVVKVDAPFWVSPPWVRTFGWLDVNRNKRSAIFDLRSEEGREALWRLIDTADVVIENYRLGKVAALGFGFEEVARRRPGIVYVSLNAYDFGGPFSGRPGWDPNAQAISGMELRGGGDVPAQAPAPINDYATGVAGAFGAVLALREARRTGSSQHVRGSLARTASLLLDSQRAWSSAAGAPGAPAWLENAFEYLHCRDGWIAVDGVGLEGREVLEAGDRAEALAVFAGRGARAASVRSPDELQQLDWVRKAGLLRSSEHPYWGGMSHVAATPPISGMTLPALRPAPEPGDDTVGILEELGYSPKQISVLLASAAAQSLTPLFAR